MAPPSASVSPRYSNQPLHSRSDLTRDGRLLPSKNVTDEDIDDSFAKFVLYCNPHYSSTTETTELKRVFRNPPRSDGKDFSIFRLFELLQKYERKEIKTWNQVALDLGVEPPTTENGGSTQKVQQYSVRLKVCLSWDADVYLTLTKKAMAKSHACRCLFRLPPGQGSSVLPRHTTNYGSISNSWQRRGTYGRRPRSSCIGSDIQTQARTETKRVSG